MSEEQKRVAEIFSALQDCHKRMKCVEKEISSLWKDYSNTILEEQEQLRVLLKDVLGEDWQILFRNANVLARSEGVEAHFLWPENISDPIYRVGFFTHHDKCQSEIEIGSKFEKVLEWASKDLKAVCQKVLEKEKDVSSVEEKTN